MGFTDSPAEFGEENREERGFALLVQTMAGPLSEIEINPKFWESTGHHDDDVATGRKIAAIAVCKGMTNDDGALVISTEEMERRKPEIDALISRSAQAAGKLVAEHFLAIVAVANLLIQRTSLTAEEVAEVVKSPPQLEV
jgi:hypothetical protein